MSALPSPSSARIAPSLVQRLGMGLRHWAQRIPTRCWLCDAWPSRSPFCPACVQAHLQPATPALPRCLHCALRLPHADGLICGACLKQPPPLLRVWAEADYAPPWRGLIADWKFFQNPALAQPIAALMWAGQGQQVQQSYLAAGARPCLLPIPPEPSRLRWRGYHHSLMLAQALAQHSGWPVQAQALLRLPNLSASSGAAQNTGPQQAKRRRAERLAAMKNAFILHSTHGPSLRGQHVLLIDDVMTTGATLHSAALCLQSAGVASVSAWVFARTGR